MNAETSHDRWAMDDAAYVLGALSPAERSDFEAHLAGCEECQNAVVRLAGMPGLLSLTSAAMVEDPMDMPSDMLDSILAAQVVQMRRRRWTIRGSVLLAAACVVGLVFALTAGVRSPSAPAAAAPPPSQAMTQLVAGPMTASVALVDKGWGTSLVLSCHYSGSLSDSEVYELYVVDRSNQAEQVGSWNSGSNSATVTTATSLHRSDISAIEVRLPDGTPILRLPV